ncbi:MAG: serine/threonine-protein kinase [Planctomycetota bacterium]|nr:serine/threonine-protein kinase [Planctomycetota bacterium]
MVTLTCPNPEDLRSFHLGMLDERRELEVLDHLNACQTCEDTVANLEGTVDSLIAAVRNSAESESSAYEDRPALQQALVEIEGLIDQPVSPDTKQADEASPVTERIRDYELLETLGEGGMGTVYRARHTRLDRQVALKLLPARRLRDNAAVARFEREMKAIGRLDHPTIVRATDAGDVDGTHFLAMDYVEGIDLSKLVRLVGPLDVASACEIVRQAAIGLDYAHQQDLIHRDVKPSNLMLTLRGEVRILDLGLALFGAASEAVDDLTTVGQLMGTLDYMAPEQGDNSHDVDARADVYSLGATLFKLLTGTAPYETSDRRNPLQKMKALATTDPPPVLSRRADVPPELAAAIDRMLLRDPDERFQSAAEVAAAVASFCESSEIEDLAERGLQLAAPQREAEQSQSRHLAPRDEPLEVSASKRQPAAHAVPSSEQGGVSGNAQPAQQNGSSRGARWLRWSILTTIALFAGVVIWLRTDNGTLLIEADESVPVEIRSGQKVVANETLKVGQNSLTIRSGEYEIVLPKEYDSLKVEDGKFELLRGGTWIARVTKQSDVVQSATPASRWSSLPERSSAIDSVLPSNNPFAPAGSGADSPARQAGPTGLPRFELETTLCEIDQQAIRDGVTGPPLLSPRSALEILDPIVSDAFLYPHQEFQDQPLPAFVLYRSRENVTQVLHAPPLNKCVRKVNAPTKSEHDPEPEAGSGAYTDADGSFMTSDGSRYSRRLAPSLNAAGQMSLALEFERVLRIGEPRADERTDRKTFLVDPLREGETLIVLEVDPNADKVWLFLIKPVDTRNGLLASASGSVLPSSVPSSNDPFAPPFPSNDPFAPAGSDAQVPVPTGPVTPAVRYRSGSPSH